MLYNITNFDYILTNMFMFVVLIILIKLFFFEYEYGKGYPGNYLLISTPWAIGSSLASCSNHCLMKTGGWSCTRRSLSWLKAFLVIWLAARFCSRTIRDIFTSQLRFIIYLHMLMVLAIEPLSLVWLSSLVIHSTIFFESLLTIIFMIFLSHASFRPYW